MAQRSQAQDAYEFVISEIASRLKGDGFKRSGAALLRDTGESLQVVSFQKSLSSERDRGKFTVNVGCDLKNLHVWYRTGRKIRRAENCTYSERIGLFQNEPRDKWWTISDAKDARLAIDEIVALLPKAFEKLNDLSTEAGLRKALANGSLKGSYPELRGYLDRDPNSDHWPGWDLKITDYGLEPVDPSG